jgi:hypothetical protein
MAFMRSWIPAYVVALLAVGWGCDAPQTATTQPFAEINALGLTRYVGTVTPSEVVPGEVYTTYEFRVEDGPICLRGAPFSVRTRPGNGRELIIYLQGGGACWSDLCQAFPTVFDAVPASGILNPDLVGNPVSEWDVGYVPYCDGSLFAGDVEVDVDGDGEVDRYQRGLLNLSAALDAIHTEFPQPERILVVGSSAGAYGTIAGAMLTRYLYPGVPIGVIADGGIGLGKPGDPDFILGLIAEWGIDDLLPASCDDCLEGGHITGLTSWALERDPLMTAYAITSLEDSIIGTMFLGIGGASYAEAVRTETARMAARHGDQYRYFVFEGVKHTTVAVDSTIDFANATGLPFDIDPVLLMELLGAFDVSEVNGMTAADWLDLALRADPEFTSLSAANP